MKLEQYLCAFAIGTAGLLGTAIIAPHEARAQSQTTGAIQGVVKDAKSGEALPAVTVVATATALQQTQTAITDEKGFYKISDLPPGDYKVTFYYTDITIEQNDIHVGVNKVTAVFQNIDQTKAGTGEVIHVQGSRSTVDPTSTTQGITLDTNYLRNVPVPGRTFDAMLGAAAGSTGDALGVAFSGSTSLENQYYVDGVSVTGLTYGTVGSPVVNDFIEEIEIITGGYNAEYGRSTGGIVNVTTKTGSNEVKGSIFAYYEPGQLTAAAQLTPINAGSIDSVTNKNFVADFGFELGGPIIKDKLWYFIGFDPMFNQYDTTRITKRETDCRVPADPAAGIPQGNIPGLSPCNPTLYGQKPTPDIYPTTGYYITDQLDSEIRSQTASTYNTLAKINYAATPEHQGQLMFSMLPSNATVPNIFGPSNQAGLTASELTTDLSGKWTSKFNDNKTEVEAIIGWHRDYIATNPINPQNTNQPEQVLEDGDLYTWGQGGNGWTKESQKTLAGCYGTAEGNMNAVYPNLQVPCPMDTRPYVTGGIGSLNRDTEQRESAKISVTERFKAAGSHEVKAGVDGENNTSSKARLYTGGEFIQNFVGGQSSEIIVDRWVQLGANKAFADNPDPAFFNQLCQTPNPNPTGTSTSGSTLSFYCAQLSGVPGSRGTQVESNTLNWAAYAQDSWQILPNLTLNYGLRYEEQRLRYASFLQNTVDPLTRLPLGENAMTLNNEWAPRVGLLYDWTKEGRSKIYAHWGRFYENIPMDINDRSFGGEVTQEEYYSPSQCGMTDPAIGGPNGKNCTGTGQLLNHLIGADGELVEPGIQAEYQDEFIAGFEYEILDDLKIGVNYQNRSFGRIIEDVSTDGANTYIIANPGEFSSSAQESVEKQIAATDDPTQKALLQHYLQEYESIRSFDTGRRDYNALQFTLTRRFSKKLYVQASYTYSRTEGNYPGSYSPDNGQVDPNISSQFDLIELLANRIGPLPQDRPHYIKVDGYYTFDFKRKGQLTVGIRLRALSGTPIDTLGSHYLYGADESFLLPRGELGRTDFEHGLDLHAGWGKSLRKGLTLEVFFDVFNVYNRQGTAAVDETYAPPVRLAGLGTSGNAGALQNANPVSGGTYEDLIWVKTIDSQGNESNQPIGRNPDFLNTVARYAPTYARIGARLTF